MKKTKTNWIAWGLTVDAAYVVGILWLLGLQSIGAFFHGNTELNAVGDFLAGIFAFPAFVLLAAAVITQRQELNEAREQFEDGKEVTRAQLDLIRTQNDISHKAAKANYKLAIYEKRLSVYLRLKECALELTYVGKIEREIRQKIYAAVEDTKFLFGDEVNEYTSALSGKIDDIIENNYRAARLGDKREGMRLDEKDERDWNDAVDEVRLLENWFFNNLTYEILDKVFTPSLKLPEDIE